jgi:tRNA 2-thiouridine synthesizing protein A
VRGFERLVLLMPDKTLDVKGLACPLPVLKARKALAELPKGATLEVLSTDPASPADFTAFAESTGNALLEQSESGGVYRFLLRHSA